MDYKTPTFNLKTGADSDLIVAREVTQPNSSANGKIKRKEGIFRFPYLTRRTGDTLTGNTENIESNELKHGRTKSAPRKGTSSSSGDINFEFSPETFDDMMEAVFRGKWKRWKSDTNSVSNKEKNVYPNGYFATKCATSVSGRKLIFDGNGSGNSEGLVKVANNGKGFVVHELNPGTEDIKYSLLRRYGGQTGEDLWQEFTHCALNTFQLSVEINSIITGSFGIMGSNNPKLFDSNEIAREFEGRMESIANADKLVDKGTWAASKTYAVNDFVYETGTKAYYKCKSAHTSTTTFDKTKWDKFSSYKYFESIPDHATNTDQFTAREGFLYVNGKQIQFAQSLSFTLDNGLQQKFAIFMPNAISTVPVDLNISGDLSTYVVGGVNEAKDMFNNAVDDETVELLWCVQDKLENPTAVYVFQIFNAKHTSNNIDGNGADTFNETLPWQSFGEQACRVFRIMLPRITDAEAVVTTSGDSPVTSGNPNTLILLPNIELEANDVVAGDFEITSTLNGTDNTSAMAFGTPTLETKSAQDDYGMIELPFTAVTQTGSKQTLDVTIKWRGIEFSKSFTIPAKATT